MKRHFAKFVHLIIVFLALSCSNYDDDIIDFAENKYASNFTDAAIDLTDVFVFPWDKLFVFSPMMYPQDISSELGFHCKCDIVPEGEYLYVFVKQNELVKMDIFQTKIGFSEDRHTGVHVISSSDAKYTISKIGDDNYWLRKR